MARRHFLKIGFMTEGPQVRGSSRMAGSDHESQEDREDRAALNTALDKLERGELETISHAELKASLGLD